MSRTKRFLGGVFFGYAQQALVTVTGLWLTPFLLQRIGLHDYGLWLVGLQILTWLTLMDFGIVALLPRETAYALGRGGSAEQATDLPHVIAQTARIVLRQWPIAAALAAAVWLMATHSSPALKGPIAIVVAAFIIGFPLRIFHAVLEGLQDLHFIGRVQIISWASGVIASVSLVIAGLHIYALAIGWAVTQLGMAISCLTRVKTRFPFVLPSSLSAASTKVISNHYGRGLWISLGQIAQVLLDGTDLLIVGKTMGTTSVVPYACTEKLIGVLSNQPAMIMHAASPGLSAIKSGGQRGQAFQIAVRLTQAMLLLSGLVICIVLAVNHAFVNWWVGKQQFAGSYLTMLLTLAMLLRHWNTSTVYSIFCFGHERRLAITSLVDGSVSAIASFVLIKRFGLIGAPLGSIVGACFIALPSNLFTLSKESETGVLSALSPLWPWFWRFVVVALGSAALPALWIPLSPVGLALATSLVASVYAAAMFPMLIRSSLRAYLPKPILAFGEKLTGLRPELSLQTVDK